MKAHKKNNFARRCSEAWPANKSALEEKCLAYSLIAKTVSSPCAKRLLYEFKAQTLGAIFRGAKRELKQVPKVRIDPYLKFQGAPVYSVRLRRRLWVHQPHVNAAQFFLVEAESATTRKSKTMSSGEF